jgi:spermidine synthase
LTREAVALQPDEVRMRLILAGLLSRAHRTDEAAAECREALRLVPNYPEAHNNLAWLLKDQGKFTEALEHFREAVRLRPGSVPSMMGLAWLLGTHPDPRLRDPREAVRLGERVVELSPPENWMASDTLAAAYAAAGRFPEAAQTAQRALEMARTVSPKDIPAVEARLALYSQHRPFLENNSR